MKSMKAMGLIMAAAMIAPSYGTGRTPRASLECLVETTDQLVDECGRALVSNSTAPRIDVSGAVRRAREIGEQHENPKREDARLGITERWYRSVCPGDQMRDTWSRVLAKSFQFTLPTDEQQADRAITLICDGLVVATEYTYDLTCDQQEGGATRQGYTEYSWRTAVLEQLIPQVHAEVQTEWTNLANNAYELASAAVVKEATKIARTLTYCTQALQTEEARGTSTGDESVHHRRQHVLDNIREATKLSIALCHKDPARHTQQALEQMKRCGEAAQLLMSAECMPRRSEQPPK
ncbi:MAG: hypothetical protein LBJ69_02050 [Holosporales bacterium]|jgi:hypothetical protein|nr:hypothetical protein [Holosporales bacterium]